MLEQCLATAAQRLLDVSNEHALAGASVVNGRLFGIGDAAGRESGASRDAEMGHAGGSPHPYRCPLLPSTRLPDSESHSGRLHP